MLCENTSPLVLDRLPPQRFAQSPASRRAPPSGTTAAPFPARPRGFAGRLYDAPIPRIELRNAGTLHIDLKTSPLLTRYATPCLEVCFAPSIRFRLSWRCSWRCSISRACSKISVARSVSSAAKSSRPSQRERVANSNSRLARLRIFLQSLTCGTARRRRVFVTQLGEPVCAQWVPGRLMQMTKLSKRLEMRKCMSGLN